MQRYVSILSLKNDYNETQEGNWYLSKALVKFEQKRKLKMHCKRTIEIK